MEKKKELMYNTYRTLYSESIKNVVAISGFLYRVKRRLWGIIPLPYKYKEKVEFFCYNYKGDFNELMKSVFSAKDRREIESVIEKTKKTLTDKRKELSKRKRK